MLIMQSIPDETYNQTTSLQMSFMHNNSCSIDYVFVIKLLEALFPESGKEVRNNTEPFTSPGASSCCILPSWWHRC